MKVYIFWPEAKKIYFCSPNLNGVHSLEKEEK